METFKDFGAHRLLACAAATVMLVACTNPPPRPIEANGTYCYKVGKSRSMTCTPATVPDAATEAMAKTFVPVGGAVTLYVVRNLWDDSRNLVPVSIDGRTEVVTVPESFFRVILPPGQHRITLTWGDQHVAQVLNGAAGELVFAEVDGTTWVQSAQYRWFPPNGDRARQHARSARLIANLDLRR